MGKLINKFRPYARIFLAVWIVLVIVLAILPDLPVPRIGGKQIPIRLDYPVHFLEHTLLAFLAIISFVTKQTQKRTISFTLYSLILFALTVEFIQIFLPFRSFEFQELGFNIAGILIGTIIALLSIGEKKQK
ncbi:MAG: VanZ family protein [Bacteroidales bacterium]|nr:VanZ family protein [Bacteroidales bacterium]